MERERLIAIFQTLGLTVLMSLGAVLTKMSLGNVAPLTFVAYTIIIGCTVMAVVTFGIRGERIPKDISRQAWFLIGAIGIGNFAIARVLSTVSLDIMPATTNAFLMNFVGFLTMGMSIFLLKESPTIFQVIGAVVAFIGLRVFFTEMPSSDEWTGIILIFIAIVAVAYTNNAARQLALVTNRKLSNNIISTMALLIGGVPAVIVCFILEPPTLMAETRDWFNAVYAGVILIALGLTGWNYILRTLRSYEASILGVATVVFTALFAIPMLGESLNWNQVAGIALLLSGLALVQVRASFVLPRRSRGQVL